MTEGSAADRECEICFVMSVNSDSLAQQAKQHLTSLLIPTGVKVSVLELRGAPSMTAAYNHAIRTSKAKYKVYLHQDVMVLNRHLIIDIMSLFMADGSVGMMGLCGSSYVPNNGIWWECPTRYGKVLENRGIFHYLDFSEVASRAQTVAAVDGFLIATQYDIPWREDLFDGWHFYDTSQCLEFQRRGLKTVIPSQYAPWALHLMGAQHAFDQSAYEHYRVIFLKEYGGEIGPNPSFGAHRTSAT